MKKTLIFDVETHRRERMYSLPPEEFIRLIGYRWDDGDVIITDDLDELKAQINKARWIVGHNIHDADLRWVFGHKSNVPMELADEGRVYDTWTHAVLVNPPPYKYVNREGRSLFARKPGEMMRWFSLDEQAYQLGVGGKTDELKRLARQFVEKGEDYREGFGRIPLDNEEYQSYLRGDVLASTEVAKALLRLGPLDSYALREQRVASRMAAISSNGMRVDVVAAQKRVAELEEQRRPIVEELVQKWGMPTAGKAPWSSKEGKEAILRALESYGITPESRPDWPRTDKNNISFGKDAMVALTSGTDAEPLGEAISALMGQRSLAQQALDTMYEDGFAHPEITALQKSRRWSTTKPGFTTWTARGPGAEEKKYYLPDTEEEVLLEIDYSNADARIVAAYSGDTRYAIRFEPGQDGHLLNALAVWGEVLVLESEESKSRYRQMAKPYGHGWNYGGGPEGLVKAAGGKLEDAKRFCDGMANEYPVLVDWQNEMRRKARRDGYLTSHWEGKLYPDRGKEWTQAPALMGQNGTREIVCDALLSMPYEVLRRVKAQIHDALLFSIPKKDFERWRDGLCRLMTTSLHPKGGQEIGFPVEAGPPGHNWMEASHV